MVEVTEALLLPLIAIAWLVFIWFWKQGGFKSKNGLKFIGIGAAWLLFYHAFQVFANVLSGQAYSATILAIGQWVGGTLAWLFGFIGALYLVIENFKM
ncbi:MAG: hypothetical protein J7K73_02955 [Nanoarchaeota archaeon]|nr:hypothetical protein [Nanoarchaeota archaeon]